MSGTGAFERKDMVAHLSSSDFDPSGIVAAFGVFYMFMLLIALAVWVFMVYVYWRIATKAGYPGGYSLLLLVPIANIVVMVMFAFRPWPIELRPRHCARSSGSTRPGRPASGSPPTAATALLPGPTRVDPRSPVPSRRRTAPATRRPASRERVGRESRARRRTPSVRPRAEGPGAGAQ